MTKFKWLIMTVSISTGMLTWWLILPTKIIDVHYKSDIRSYYIIVKNLPFTDRRKIQWWENNKPHFKQLFHIPVDENGYAINFWIGKYRSDSGTAQDSDLLCFDDMQSKDNCIAKDNQPMTIWFSKYTDETIYLLNNWDNKYIKDNKSGAIRKIR